MSVDDDKDFSNAFNMCCARLKVNNYLTNTEEVDSMSRKSGLLCHEMYYSMLAIKNKFLKYDRENEASCVEEMENNSREDFMIPDDHNTDEYYLANQQCKEEEEKSAENYEPFELTQDDNENENSATDSWSIMDIVDEQDEQDSFAEDEESKIDIDSKVIFNYSIIKSCQVVLSNSNKVQRHINELEKEMNKKQIINNYGESWLKQEDALDKKKCIKQLTSYDEKERIVNLHRDNPTWSWRELRDEGDCQSLHSSTQLIDWKNEIREGGVKTRMKKINAWVYQQCIKYAENNNKNITGKLITQWALEAKKIYWNKKIKQRFTASHWWAWRFKKTYLSSLIGNLKK